MPDVSEPALREAITTILGHGPPFSRSELREIRGPLVVRNARTLAGLELLTGLRALDLAGSDITSLAAIRGLSELTTLRVLGSLLRDIGALATARKLRLLYLDFCRISDLTPLLALEQHLAGSLLANPLSDESYHALRPELLRRHSLEFSKEESWRFSRECAERGVRAGYDRLYGNYACLLQVGRAGSAEGCLYARTSERFLPQILAKQDLTTESLFDQVNLLRSFGLTGLRVPGRDVDARGWVAESTLDAEEKQHLLRFVARFPGQTFYRDTPGMHDLVEEKSKGSLPPQLTRIQQVLSFLAPDFGRWELAVRFDPAPEGVSGWYFLPCDGPPDSDHVALIESRGLHSIGMAVGGGSWLGLRSDPACPHVVRYRDDILWSDAEAIPAFETYAELLGSISALRFPDSTEIEALPV